MILESLIGMSSIWNTGSQDGGNPMGTFQQLLQSFGPMLDGLDGKVSLPTYLPQKPSEK